MATTVTLFHPVAFRSFVERLAEVLPNLPIEVAKDDEFCGLRTHCIDRTAVCVASARLSVPAHDIVGSGTFFCLKTKEILTYLPAKTVDGSTVVVLKHDAAEDHVEIQLQNKSRGQRCLYKCKKLAQKEDPCAILDIEQRHTVHVRISDLAAFLALAKSLDYSTITFRICEAAKSRFFTFLASVNGAAVAEQTYCHPLKGDSSEDVIDLRSDTGGDATVPADADVLYSDTFNRDYLSKFCCARSGHSPTFAELSFPATPGEPMVLSFGLGVEASFVKFILASTEEGV